MPVTFYIVLLIISVIQLSLLHTANHADGMKKIMISEAARYLMVGPVLITFMLSLVYVLDGDVLRLGFTLSIFAWSSYYLSFGSPNRLAIPILNLIVSIVGLVVLYISTY